MKNICIIIYKKFNKTYIPAISVFYFLKNYRTPLSYQYRYWYPCFLAFKCYKLAAIIG